MSPSSDLSGLERGGNAVFRVSEVPSSVQGRGTPKSPQIPDSEFPSFRGPLLALGSQQEGLANSQIPSFRV